LDDRLLRAERDLLSESYNKWMKSRLPKGLVDTRADLL